MIDKLEIGPTPAEESCQQVGTPGYDPAKARAECRAFISLIKRTLGEPPQGASLIITSNPHDFGTYHDVAVRFDDNYPEAVEYAFKVESGAPAQWDDKARKELRDGTPNLGIYPKD